MGFKDFLQFFESDCNSVGAILTVTAIRLTIIERP
jgi:hypothetical protein